MRFESELTINAPRLKVWDFFQDVEKLAGCIPGCESVEPVDDSTFKAVLAEKLGPFRVSFQVDIKVEEVDEGRFIRASVTGQERKLFSSFRQTLEARFTEVDSNQTDVAMVTEVSFRGKIASLGHVQIKRKAEQAMQEFGDRVRSALEGP